MFVLDHDSETCICTRLIHTWYAAETYLLPTHESYSRSVLRHFFMDGSAMIIGWATVYTVSSVSSGCCINPYLITHSLTHTVAPIFSTNTNFYIFTQSHIYANTYLWECSRFPPRCQNKSNSHSARVFLLIFMFYLCFCQHLHFSLLYRRAVLIFTKELTAYQ